jgi:hypothetical protein
MRPLWTTLALLAVAPLAAAQEATVVSEPEDDYLLEVTREWSELAGLGDLRTTPLDQDDIELRVWGGYGLVGTRAAILRRIGGEWEGLTLYVERYRAAATDSLAEAEGVLPPCIVEAMADRCKARESRMMGSGPTAGQVVGVLYHLECPYARRVSDNYRQESYARLWEDVVGAGVLTLPPEVEREWVMTDGHSYVVEVRAGDTYRASSIEHTAPEVEADRQVQAIAQRLARMLHASIYPYWDEREESGD